MRTKNSNKRVFYIIGGIIAVIIVGLGIKFLVGKKEKRTSNEQKSLTPLNKLSDPELEKCLLEDFSRRLELKKYFVFNLGELKTVQQEPIGYDNCRVASANLISHLTQLATQYQKELEKKGYQVGGKINKRLLAFQTNNNE